MNEDFLAIHYQESVDFGPTENRPHILFEVPGNPPPLSMAFAAADDGMLGFYDQDKNRFERHLKILGDNIEFWLSKLAHRLQAGRIVLRRHHADGSPDTYMIVMPMQVEDAIVDLVPVSLIDCKPTIADEMAILARPSLLAFRPTVESSSFYWKGQTPCAILKFLTDKLDADLSDDDEKRFAAGRFILYGI